MYHVDSVCFFFLDWQNNQSGEYERYQEVSEINLTYFDRMATKSRMQLVNFFVFNSNFGPREGEEHNRILLYYPSGTDLDVQIKNVGLCEAVIKFTGTFTNEHCQSIHTQKSRQMFFSPEEDYWLILTVTIPTTTHGQKDADGHSRVDYHEEDVQDSVYEAVLKQAYKMFCFFMGPFCDIMTLGNVEHLKQRLEYFFTRYLPVQKWDNCDILSIFHGIHFLPLDKNTYLRIQSFLNLLESSFTNILYTVFMYNDQLVWSGLEQEDMRTLYHYLTTTLFPKFIDQELQSSVSKSPQATPSRSCENKAHFGKFVTGPPSMKDTKNLGKTPQIFLNTRKKNEKCHLVVYRALSASICMFIEGDFQLTFEFFELLDAFIGPQLSALASDISELYNKRTTPSSDYGFKYVYFNQLNLAQKTSIHADSHKRAGNTNVSAEMMRLMADLNNDLNGITSVEDGETIVKTKDEAWVVGKKSDQREFYVVLTQRNANLIEVNDEIKKLCNTHFQNIFFMD